MPKPNEGIPPRAGTLVSPLFAASPNISSGKNQLTIENGLMRVECSPQENAFQPSINALFRSATSVYGRRVIGIVLTGMM